MKEPQMPYQNIEAFNPESHGALIWGLPPNAAGAFAETSTVPLTVPELPHALRHYPLVFLDSPEGPLLAAVLGLADGRNLFVEENGLWRQGVYLPAYIRRYPFHALTVEGQSDPVLGLDRDAAGWQLDENNPDETHALLEPDGQPTPWFSACLNLNREFLAAGLVTRAMSAALLDAGVLVAETITIEPAEMPPRRVDGFLRVSEEKLRALGPEALVKLHQADALGLAYAQLLSMANWSLLAERLVSPSGSAPVTAPRRATKASRSNQAKSLP